MLWVFSQSSITILNSGDTQVVLMDRDAGQNAAELSRFATALGELARLHALLREADPDAEGA